MTRLSKRALIVEGLALLLVAHPLLGQQPTSTENIVQVESAHTSERLARTSRISGISDGQRVVPIAISDEGLADAAEKSAVCSAINDYRVTAGLAPLRVDEMTSHLMTGWLVETLRSRKSAGGLSVEEIAHIEYLPDWDSRTVLLNSPTVSALSHALVNREDLKDVLLYPDATHVTIALASLDGDTLSAAVCVSRRLVTLGPFGARAVPTGITLTLQGSTAYQYVRVRFYKSTADPNNYSGPDCVQDVSVGPDGHFDVSLPISKFGNGRYRILVYVSEHHPGGYEIAAQTYFSVREGMVR